jgi:hypothetical protein
VYRKDKNFASTESRLPNGQPVLMPYSVFFEDGGIAFHAGDGAAVCPSAGAANTALTTMVSAPTAPATTMIRR